MISDRNKKILFGLLLLIAVAIWSRNLGFFTDSSGFYRVNDNTAMRQSQISSGQPYVTYRKPRINPFKPVASANPQKSSFPPPPKPRENSLKIPPAISSSYIFDGFVMGSSNSQAILRDPGGPNAIVAVGDSLKGWKVYKIGSDYIVFSSGDYRDTLRLKNAASGN